MGLLHSIALSCYLVHVTTFFMLRNLGVARPMLLDQFLLKKRGARR